MTSCLLLLASCLPMCTMESMRIKNCTTDTILIGASFSNNIDSVYINVYGGRFRFLPCSGDTCDYTWTTINEKGMLEIRKLHMTTFLKILRQIMQNLVLYFRITKSIKDISLS